MVSLYFQTIQSDAYAHKPINIFRMALVLNISSIIGTPPFDIYICQTGGTGCFYINTTSETSYSFDIPQPYDTNTAYMLKVVDNTDCIITGITFVT